MQHSLRFIERYRLQELSDRIVGRIDHSPSSRVMKNLNQRKESRLSLVVPTRNRLDFLKRLLDYYGSQDCGHRILIADSSESAVQMDTKRIIESLKCSVKIEHVEFPPDTEFHSKLEQTLDLVNTPYVVVGADDDFHVLSNLARAAEFMEFNQDHSLVHGDAVLFQLTSGTAHGKISGTVRYEQRSLDQATGAARLKSHVNNYSTTWYSVQRTAELRTNFQKMAVFSKDSYFGELLPSFLSVIQGKSKMLDSLFMVRQAHSQTAGSQQALSTDIFDRITDESWSIQYSGLHGCLSEALANQDRISVDEANQIVKKLLWSYFTRDLSDSWKLRYQHGNPQVLSDLKRTIRRLPAIRGAWHKARVGMRSFIPGNENSVLLPELLRPGSKYHSNFMPIYRAITEVPSVIGTEDSVETRF